MRSLATAAAVLLSTVAFWAAPAAAAPGDDGIGLEVKGPAAYAAGDPVRLTLTVANHTGAACGLAKAAEGTVGVVAVRKDGADVQPLLTRSFYADGLPTAIHASLASTPDGASVEVPFPSLRLADGPFLRSVTSTDDGGGLDALWPVGAVGRYEVTLAYAIPAVDGACAGTSSAVTVPFTIGAAPDEKGVPLWWWVIAALVVVVALAAVFLLVRRRKGTAAVAVLLMVAAVSMALPAARAEANVEIDPNAGIPQPGVDFAGLVNGCLTVFAKPGGDPAGILPRLKDPKSPKVRIIPTTGGSNTFETSQSKDGKGSSTITWNPTSTDPYSDGVARDACAALYHELNHADDISKDQVPEGECGDTGIRKAEVKATFAENRYRKAQGLPPRVEYDGKKLPSSYDECKKPKKKEPPKKGPVKLCEASNSCATSNGDPHLATFDRAYYDFQAVGEFVAVRSTSGDPLEIQVRQSPLAQSRTVALNTAIGFRANGHTVSLTLAGGVTQVRIDGKLTVVPEGETRLPDGAGVLTRRPSDTGKADGYDLSFADKSWAAADPIGHYGYRLLVGLDEKRAGEVEGLLGDSDGDPADDIAPKGGRPLARPVPFGELYKGFADSWRIEQKDSLLYYADGENTAKFTDKSFPDKPVTIEDLDAQRRANAENICRWAGVTAAWQLAECIFDVAVTGRADFAVSSAGTERAAASLASPITAAPLVSGSITAGTSEQITFTSRAGQAVFVDISAPSITDRCSPYRLLAPDGKQLNSGCNINGRGYIDRTPLPAEGKYTVDIDSRDGLTGRAFIRVYAAEDVTSTSDGSADATANLTAPGSVARYTFTATAGQRAFVDVPESTLPDQCSPLALLDPQGRMLNTGCVINGSGDVDGTLLPGDGQYTVVVDPVDRTTGGVRLHVWLTKDTVEPIAVNGPAVTANIDTPGKLVRLTFTGQPGTSVSVDVADATLPNECSPITLVSPSGTPLTSSCVINGSGGIAKFTLPAAGAYAVVVDPLSNSTGTVKIALKS